MTTVLRALRLDDVQADRVMSLLRERSIAVLERGDDGASAWKALDVGARGVGPAGVGASMEERQSEYRPAPRSRVSESSPVADLRGTASNGPANAPIVSSD
jgi:hypothetical protein